MSISCLIENVYLFIVFIVLYFCAMYKVIKNRLRTTGIIQKPVRIVNDIVPRKKNIFKPGRTCRCWTGEMLRWVTDCIQINEFEKSAIWIWTKYAVIDIIVITIITTRNVMFYRSVSVTIPNVMSVNFNWNVFRKNSLKRVRTKINWRLIVTWSSKTNTLRPDGPAIGLAGHGWVTSGRPYTNLLQPARGVGRRVCT